MEQRRWLLLALALLLAIPVSEHFKVTSPEKVVGIVGQDTILPCTISSTKPLDNPQVHWIKITDGHTEDIYTYGQFGGEPMQKYRGRTSVPGDGFATGNASLTLKNVQPADEGIYSCIVTSRDWSTDTSTKLSIAELFKVLCYKGDVTLDADTAHPRLEISADGQKVKDTGVIRHVPSNEQRFDSHLFVLAKEGYTSGKHYWEVSVGKRRSWYLGIAWESVIRKGPLTLCPQNGFWAIGLADGRDCWAYMGRWTRLSVSGHLHKIEIFLNIPAKKLRFYNAHKGATLYTFSIGDGSSKEGKFIPFLSTGPATAKLDPEPLLIVQEFDDDD
ncbi:PREDICTED: LOW QUALITY PROTEIN: butyrophilin subfamily 1 member A1-like [Corvus brachyrhynchos]|uniref:LOW QUALITY PROTEIN: butyrophilin subfamily 1 member A1-like n=1 Tax=Corvus brachyrhynchos TaxID=85066 RepID=UPI000816453B|nr:PREDICTED: LOW QUALITY PROTEIN: butyrophilin subfamily 1 member A1-like [Corvus brachyrhynchos]